MHTDAAPSLTFEEVDDCLYFARADEADELWHAISALQQKYSCSVREIISAVHDPASGNTMQHYCSANGLLHILTGLLSRLESDVPLAVHSNPGRTSVALINIANAQGNTALHWASLNGHLDVVKTLVDAGADVSLLNSAGHTAALEAERAGKGLVVEYLLEASGLEMNPEDLAELPGTHANGNDASDEAGGGPAIGVEE